MRRRDGAETGVPALDAGGAPWRLPPGFPAESGIIRNRDADASRARAGPGDIRAGGAPHARLPHLGDDPRAADANLGRHEPGGSLNPFRILTAAAAIAFVTATIALLLALRIPALDLPDGARPAAVSAGTTRIVVIDTDLIEEPDVLPDHAAMDAMFARQTELHTLLATPGAEVEARLADGGAIAVEPRQRRLGDVPAMFWFQVAVGMASLFISAWVFGLRPRDAGARIYAFTGLFVFLAAVTAAVYSTRGLAMDGTQFRVLSAVNHIGTIGFGSVLVGLLGVYPRRILPVRWFAALAAVYAVVALGDVFRFLPLSVFMAVIVSQMAAAIVLGVMQWRATRRDPLNRASLRWFLIATLVGTSLFVFLRIVPTFLGWGEEAVIPQGYAFGFFLIMHGGLALGLTRYRVFDLDDLAYRVWFWFGGAILVMAIDAVLIVWLYDQPWASLSLALLLTGFVYFPLRQYFLSRFLAPNRPDAAARLADVIAMTFSDRGDGRETAWDGILDRTFRPLGGPARTARPVAEPAIIDSGAAMLVPATAGCAPRILTLANEGRRLFTPHDVAAARTLCHMATMAADNHAAHERGVREERDRIARDVHDNIGAQLLSALHAREPARKDALLRETLGELRTIVNEGFGATHDLADLMADLKSEVAERLAHAGVGLDWRAEGLSGELPVQHGHALRSIVREAVSNIVKHADAARVSVRAATREAVFELAIEDDGAGCAPDDGHVGNGLANMRARAENAGGSIAWSKGGAGGCRVELAFPLAGPSAGAKAGEAATTGAMR